MVETSGLQDPLVSVIIPVYNGARTLAEAVRSVLQQTYRPVEIIIVDDGSTDASARIAGEFGDPVHYLRQANAGPAAARNRGLREAHGEYVSFIDADDLWPADKLAAQMRCFAAFPSVEIVQGLIQRVDLRIAEGKRKTMDAEDFLFIYTNLGSMTVRKSVFQKTGYFDEGLNFHEDTDFWLRARERGVRVLVQRKLSLVYRLHGENLTAGEDLRTMGFLDIIHRSIRRRQWSSTTVPRLERLLFVSDLDPDLPDERENDQSTSWPSVSIILYAADAGARLDHGLASIRSQDYPAAEVLVIGAESKQLPTSGRDPLNRIEFLGCYPDLATGLNSAIERCRGDFVAFLDAAGEWTPGKLKAQVSHLLAHPAEGYMVGRTRQLVLPEMAYPAGLLDGLALRKSVGDLLSTLVVRRSTLLEVGEFKAGLPGMEETDWLLRANDAGILKSMSPQVLFTRFVSPESHAVEPGQMKAALLKSVRSSLMRKRNYGPIRNQIPPEKPR